MDAVTQSYDANGNLTNDGVSLYAFDYQNRLTGAAQASATYTYDPFVSGFAITQLFGERRRGIEGSILGAAISKRWVLLFPEVSLSLVGAIVVAV